MDLFRDPDEAPFLRILIERPLDLANLRAYERFLQSRHDPRAELMSLTNRMLEGIADAEERRAVAARVAELSGSPQADVWTDLLARSIRVQNCGQAKGEPGRVRFTFECPQSWGGLRPTDNPEVRFCESCSTRVVRCDTVEKAENQARLGACIAVPAGLAQSAVGSRGLMLGRPDYPALWADRLFDSP
jgi:hypothetical protein